MKAIDAIEKIKVMLGMEDTVVTEASEAVETEVSEETVIELAEAELVDGTIVKADSFSEGAAIFVVTEEGDIPAPVGVHETTDGKLVTVEEEGVIAKVEDKEMEAETEEATEEVAEFSSEDFLNQISELINSKFNELESKINKVDAEFTAYLEQPAGKKITNNLGEVQKNENELADARFNKLMEFRNQTKK